MKTKKTNKDKEWEKELREESIRAIEPTLCKKCNGVIVNSWIRSMMAVSHGKRCMCKKPQHKAKKK